MEHTIYCDHNATTRPAARVVEIMATVAGDTFGNPSSPHRVGQAAKGYLEESRATVAEFLGAKPAEITFTGSGTESDNLAIIGGAYAKQKKGRHVITSAIEHHAVLHAVDRLAELGWEITVLPVDRHGLVNPDDLKAALRDDTTLVSIMAANNEVGTMQPIRELATIAHERDTLFHTDAVQSIGKVPVDVNELGVDMLTLSAHKFYGPKGVGALYLRRGVEVDPLIFGGGQESTRRSGTEDLPGIVGMAEALKLLKEQPEQYDQAAAIADQFRTRLFEQVPDIQLHGHPEQRIKTTVNVGFNGINGEALVIALDLHGICVSSGAACSTGAIEPSHVITAMGFEQAVAESSIRFSFGRLNRMDDIDSLVETIATEVDRLRQMSPNYRRSNQPA